VFRGRDDVRIQRMKDPMRAEGLDYLIVRIAENVLYTTGYWPVLGASLAVVPLNDEATIFYEQGEEEFVADGWVKDSRAYGLGDLEHLTNPTHDLSAMLKNLWKEKGYNPKGTIGYEASFELVAANNISAESRVAAPCSLELLCPALPEARFVDASNAIRKARIVKSPLEIELIRTACEIGALGCAAARELMVPGVSEAEVSGAVEGRMYGKGVGYNGVRRARGYAFAMSGPNSAVACRPFCIASARKLERGDVVLLELDGFADGYFFDVTRTMSVGAPSLRAQEIWGIVNEALDAALGAIQPGTPAGELTRAAQQVIVDRGHGEHFLHPVGHGVGLQLHEPPSLHPLSQDLLEEGMTLAVEPAIYIPGWGGVRIEETVVVTRGGYESLSTYTRSL
jgi:Xaa-Pro aminopeptidase